MDEPHATNPDHETLLDVSRLIRSLESEAGQKIAAIEAEAAAQRERMQAAHAKELAELEQATCEEYDIRIDAEIEKIRNRASIERKKLRLSLIEDIMKSLTDEAVRELRAHHRQPYLDFLMHSILESMHQIKGRKITVKLSEDDMELESRIRQAANQLEWYEGGIILIQAEPLPSGGCIVLDEDRGTAYNCTFERIVFRKYDQIRKDIYNRFLKDIFGQMATDEGHPLR